MLLKTLAFWVGSIGFLAYGYICCRIYHGFAYLLFAMLVWSLTWPDDLSITFMNSPYYKMATRGFEVHLSDLCALILFVYLLRTSRTWHPTKAPPTLYLQLLLIFVAFISWAMIDGPIPNPLATHPEHQFDFGLERVLRLTHYPLFEITKLMRGMLIFWVSVNLSKDPDAVKYLRYLFVSLILYYTGKSLFYRYGLGIHRVSAGIGHFNNFNTFSGLMAMFLLPWAFRIRGFISSGFLWFMQLCALLCIILTISRSALLAMAMGGVAGTFILLPRFPSVKNILFIALAFVGAMAIGLKSADALLERFFVQNPTEGSQANRDLLNHEAKVMAGDFVFGVGMGNFSAWSMLRYSSITGAELGNFAHNSFFLTLGELGYPGLLVFALYWIRSYQVIFSGVLRCWRMENEETFCAAVGSFLAVVFMFPQLWWQFTYRTTPVYMLVHVLVGIGVGQYLVAAPKKRKIHVPARLRSRST